MEHEYRHDVLSNPKSQIRLLKVHLLKPDAARTSTRARGAARRIRDVFRLCGLINTPQKTRSVPSHLDSVPSHLDHGLGNVTISCTMRTFDVDCLPLYRALSYAWGPERPTRLIQIDSQNLSIRENLWHFLYQIALNGQTGAEQWLWIAQICIAQSDEIEKGHQVGGMRRIFTEAYEVLCWLGPHGEDSELAIEYLEWLVQGKSMWEVERRKGFFPLFSDSRSFTEPTLRESQALLRFFARPYWFRLWVLQEIWLAQVTVWICGTRSVTENIMTKALTFLNIQIRMHKRLQALQWPAAPILKLDWHAWPSEGPRPSSTEFRLPRKGMGLSRAQRQALLANSIDLRCALPHDHVYGMLALLYWVPPIVPDYNKAAADVFWEVIPYLQRPIFDLDQVSRLGRAMGVTGTETACRPGKGSLALACFRALFGEASPEEVFSLSQDEVI